MVNNHSLLGLKHGSYPFCNHRCYNRPTKREWPFPNGPAILRASSRVFNRKASLWFLLAFVGYSDCSDMHSGVTDMNLYLVSLKGVDGSLWDTMLSCVVRAESEQRAREIAQKSGYDETSGGMTPWLNPEESSCDVLDPEGPEDLIIRDILNS